jgi:hypothetical protein
VPELRRSAAQDVLPRRRLVQRVRFLPQRLARLGVVLRRVIVIVVIVVIVVVTIVIVIVVVRLLVQRFEHAELDTRSETGIDSGSEAGVIQLARRAVRRHPCSRDSGSSSSAAT